MTAHSYSLRSRVSSSSLSCKTPTQSPTPKLSKSPRKVLSTTSVLQLKHVIGTTTSTPSGLSCCAISNSYAYCAGSVAVFVSIDAHNRVSYRYFKARPTVHAINPTASYYDSPSASTTPTRRRNTVNTRRGYDEHNGMYAGLRDWSDDHNGQTWSARERIKSVSCVSISPDGKVLAVGETGYNPRVLLYSTAANMPTDVPLSIMTDHSIGVRSVAFSSDSKYLATLGDMNDGFLYIWQVNTRTGMAKLRSSNKCTTNICDMIWCGNSVVTVGTRHIKVWQAWEQEDSTSKRQTNLKRESEVSSPMPKPLQGRNCLLGSLVDATFTAIVAISEDKAIACTDNGQLCLLDLRMTRMEIRPLGTTKTPIAAISCRQDPVSLILPSSDGLLEERHLDTIGQSDNALQEHGSVNGAKLRQRMSSRSPLQPSFELNPLRTANMVALRCFNDKVVSIDMDGLVRVSAFDTRDVGPDICQLASHSGPVRGVQTLPKEADLGSFLTWSGAGEVRFWNRNGTLLQTKSADLDANMNTSDVVTNELKVVRYCQPWNQLITGDQFGVIKVVDCRSWITSQSIRAHSAEINDIAVHETTLMLATCSRDRMVQIFAMQEDGVELLQTSDEHIGAVSGLLFSRDGNRLLSCSADRTIVVRDRIERKHERGTISAFIPSKTITLKAAPLSISLVPTQSSVLVASTMDRHVVRLDLNSGVILSLFKVSDPESDDTTVLNSIRVGTSNSSDKRSVVVGYSAIDKSVRVYDLEKGALLGRDAGHTEGISNITTLDDGIVGDNATSVTIVSTGLDSTIMMWSVATTGQPLVMPQQEVSQLEIATADPEKVSIQPNPVALPPLRKILTKIDLAVLTRQSSPTREISPQGIRRKASKLSLTTSIDETDENQSPYGLTSNSQENILDIERCPSPSVQVIMKPKKQRSQPEMSGVINSRHTILRQSPSPPTIAKSTPEISKRNIRANNSRLRRPLSIPNDLRTQTVVHGRRQSVCGSGDFGSLKMATDQTCRMLRTYEKKLRASKTELELDEIEADLEAVLNTIRSKKMIWRGVHEGKRMTTTKSKTEEEVNELTVMLEKATVS